MIRLVADSADADQLWLDGKEIAGLKVPLVDDRREHSVEFKMWNPVDAPKNWNGSDDRASVGKYPIARSQIPG